MFLLTSPLNVYGLGSGAFNYRFSRIFLVLTFISIVIERLAKMRPLFFRLLPVEYLFGIYCYLVLLRAFYISNTGAFITKFFGLLECFMILYVIRIFTREEGCWLKSVQIYLLSSIPVLLVSLCQIINTMHGNFYESILPFPSIQLLERYDTLRQFGHFGGIIEGATRISSTFGEPNMMAGYCSSLIPYAIAVVLINIKGRNTQIRSFLNMFILFGLAAMVIATISKSGFLAMVVGILFTLAFTLNKLTAKQRICTCVVLMVILTICLFYGFQVKDLILERLEAGDSGHLMHRIEAWNYYINGRPLLGVGFGQYVHLSSHTIVLTALLELGLLGGIIILLITVQPLTYIKHLFWLSSKKNRHLPNDYLFLMSASIASYILILIGLYLYDYWVHPFVWISISLFLSSVLYTQRGRKKGVFEKL